MRTTDFLEDYLNGEDECKPSFEPFRAARGSRRKERHSDGEHAEDLRPAQRPRNGGPRRAASSPPQREES